MFVLRFYTFLSAGHFSFVPMAWLIKMRNSLLCLDILKRLYLVHKASHFYKVYDRWQVTGDRWSVDSLTLNFEEATTKIEKPTVAQYFT